MSTMIAEIYDALREAGASDEKSKAAAMAIADHGRFDRMERDVGTLTSDLAVVKPDIVKLSIDMTEVKSDLVNVKSDLAVVRAELAMVKWIVSGVGFGVVLLVIRSFWTG